jgi:hypothetical protein
MIVVTCDIIYASNLHINYNTYQPITAADSLYEPMRSLVTKEIYMQPITQRPRNACRRHTILEQVLWS